MAGASLAAACIPQPRLVTVQPRASGPSGSKVTVAALGFDPGRAEIRWNTVDGKLLGSPDGPDFSVPVVIPEAAEGLYYLVVLARSPGGEIGNTAAVAFDVTPEAGTPAATSPTPPQRVAAQGEPATKPTSASRTVLAAGTGAVVALAVIGATLLARRRRETLTAGRAGSDAG